jgi:hypothetical protein
MKFILRFLTVLAVAVGLGLLLYFAVEALPNNSRASRGGSTPRGGLTTPESQTSRAERPEGNRNEGIRWRAIARVARRTFVFVVIVFVAILAKNSLFDRGGNFKKIREP